MPAGVITSSSESRPQYSTLLDPAGERVDTAWPLADLDLLGPDRHHRARAMERLLAHAGKRDVRACDLDPVPVLALDVELEHVAIAHEARDVQIGGLGIDLRRGADLLHQAVLHHHDPIGQRQRLVLVVRHVDGGAVELAMDAADLRPRLDAQLGVEIRQRLVHEDQRRLDDDGAGDGHALLLAAGELSGQLVLLAGELHEPERMRHARRAVGGRDAAHPQAEADVLGDGHVRKQRVVLEHHAEAALFGGSVSMRCSSSQMLPLDSCMRPAMQLSAVDLPQPDGPSRR